MGESGMCVCGFISSNWYYLWWPFVNLLHLTFTINLCQSLVLFITVGGGVIPTKYSRETLVRF